MGPDGGQRLVEGHQPLSFKCVAIISLGCQLFQCWASNCRYCWNLRAAELWGTWCQLWPLSSRGMFGSQAHQISSMKCHIKTLGLWLHAFPVCGAENTPCIKGSRNEQSWKLVMSPLLCMQHWFGGIFSSRMVLLQLKCNSKSYFLNVTQEWAQPCAHTMVADSMYTPNLINNEEPLMCVLILSLAGVFFHGH